MLLSNPNYQNEANMQLKVTLFIWAAPALKQGQAEEALLSYLEISEYHLLVYLDKKQYKQGDKKQTSYRMIHRYGDME